MKKLTISTTMLFANMVATTGCEQTKTGVKGIAYPAVEQYVINGQICTTVWWHKDIAWAKYRPINTPKDTLRKDSIEAERIFKTIKSLK